MITASDLDESVITWSKVPPRIDDDEKDDDE